MMSPKRTGPTVALLGLLLLIIMLSSVTILAVNNSSSSHPIRTLQLGITGDDRLGIDCGLGTTQAVANSTSFPVSPSESNPAAAENLSSCTWAGDAGQTFTGTNDRINEPLVSDQDENLTSISPVIGGGFTAVMELIQNSTSTVNGFDLQVQWNPGILHAVGFDLSGLLFSNPQYNPFPAVRTIDNVNGNARLGIVISSPFGGNLTLFRIRFDVVGVGVTNLHITAPAGIGLTNPSPVAYQATDGAFDSETLFDPGHTINWSASFTNSTPILPGSASTFMAMVSGGTTPYKFGWQFNSCNGNAGIPCTFTAQATGNPVTVTLPATAPGFRIDLEINDSASHIVHLVRNIPFTLGSLHDSTNPTGIFAVNTAQTFNALWLGGVPPYHGNMRFCPGIGSTSNAICTLPNPAISDTTPTQTFSKSVTYSLSGVYTDTLTLTDSGPAFPGGPSSGASTLLANVTGGPPAYTVAVTETPTLPVPGASVSITAHITYATGYPATSESSGFSYNFAFGDGSTQSIPSGTTTIMTSHSYSSSGNFTIRIIARETTIARAPSQIQEVGYGSVSVYPAISGSFSLSSGTSAQTGQSITFSPSISGGSETYTYSWTFGDGGTDTTANPSHTYSAQGTYNVTLTVTDSTGRTFVSSQSVNVSTPNNSPPWLLYAIIGVVVAVAVVGVLLVLRRRGAGKATTI